MIGIRSYMSKIIESGEIGKVFSFMTALDTTAPMLASTLYNFVFKYTINSYPGAVFQITAILMFIPIWIVMWIDLFTVRPTDEIKGKHRNRNNLNAGNNNNDIVNETKM